jgi:hypothetical protein
MSQFDVEGVSRIAQEAAREQSAAVKVVGVVLGAGSGDYVEILVTIEGCAAEPCQFSLGVFRNSSEAAVKHAFSEQLRRHLEQHRSAQSAEK